MSEKSAEASRRNGWRSRGPTSAEGRRRASQNARTHSLRANTIPLPHEDRAAVAGIADSLCRLIEHTPEMKRIPLMLVDQHVDAVRAIVREYPRSDLLSMAAALTKGFSLSFSRRWRAMSPMERSVVPPILRARSAMASVMAKI